MFDNVKYFFGIDLGTTNSAISVAEVHSDGTIFVEPIEIDRIADVSGIEGDVPRLMRAKTLPSCVYYSEAKVIVGNYAREQYKRYPERVAKSIKSQMGNPEAVGLSSGVPDKTPEAISSRILAHLKKHASLMTYRNFDQVVITVPANFDAARREATMKAAEMAGFNVRNEDGSWKPILISEPNAVLYDLANKILNKKAAGSVLDLSSKKKVLVFDIGGGTLDVTFHEIEQDRGYRNVLNISEIAASRYTQLAGDDFDNAVANELYKRCIRKFNEKEPTVVPLLRARERMVKKMLAAAAEELKLRISVSAEMDFSGLADSWFDFSDSRETETTYDISCSVGVDRFYNDTITKEEFEEWLTPFLGKEYSFWHHTDYSRDKKIRRDTIIAPILDVLEKAARYYSTRGEELKVDAVILNGGMSRLYLVKDRIKEFFGLEPITTADPDLSVANGAAVYAAISEISGTRNRISIKRYVQNEDLYLGLSAGVNDRLISVGDELPYVKQIQGYKIVDDTRTLELPIKCGNVDGEPQIIARGNINFKQAQKEADLNLEVKIDQTKLLSIRAYLFRNGVQVAVGNAEIALGAAQSDRSGGDRIVPAIGSQLVPANELDALKSLFSQRNKKNLSQKRAMLDSRMETILNCGNPEAFETMVLKHLSESNPTEFRWRLYKIAGAFAPCWSQSGLAQLKSVARLDIVSDSAAYQASPQRKALSNYVKEILGNLPQ